MGIAKPADIFIIALLTDVHDELFKRRFIWLQRVSGDIGRFIRNAHLILWNVRKLHVSFFRKVRRRNDMAAGMTHLLEYIATNDLFGMEYQPVFIGIIRLK